GEILSLMGEEREVDDLFYFGVFFDENNKYIDHIIENEDEYSDVSFPNGYKESEEYIENIKKKVMKKEILEPAWMTDAHEGENWMEFPESTSLHIIAKDEKYNSLIKKMLKFLNSPESDGGRNG
ncbi:MAG: hypothetical protein ACFFDN_50930, partial [Candidatus Hodarchaeota archaeon]